MNFLDVKRKHTGLEGYKLTLVLIRYILLFSLHQTSQNRSKSINRSTMKKYKRQLVKKTRNAICKPTVGAANGQVFLFSPGWT